MTTLHIAIEPAHSPLLAALHLQGFDGPWDEAAMAGLLAMPGVFGFLAIDKSALPVGFILCRNAADEAEVLTIVIIPEQRRRGHARHLLAVALEESGRRGAKTLFLEVAADNLAAQELYQSKGFQQVGQRARYYADGSDALILQRSTAEKLTQIF